MYVSHQKEFVERVQSTNEKAYASSGTYACAYISLYYMHQLLLHRIRTFTQMWHGSRLYMSMLKFPQTARWQAM